MKKNLLLFVFISAVQFGFAQEPLKTTGFIIVGSLLNFDDSTTLTLDNANNNEQVAKGIILGGKFTLTGKILEPTLCLLKITGQHLDHKKKIYNYLRHYIFFLVKLRDHNSDKLIY